jgi:hypothetical protein
VAERHAVLHGDLAGHPDDAEAIRPVGRDLEVDHRIIGAPLDRVHRRDLEAAHGEVLRELVDRDGDVDVLLQPRDEDSHDANCSRKRRSFS